MPINKKPGESKSDFMSRCISTEIDSGKDRDQAIAICSSKWEEYAMSEFREIRLEKTRIYVDSSNVDRVMYNNETQELVIRFNDGSTYTYSEISEELFEDIIDGVDAPITSGSNKWGSWRKGAGPSVGATVYKRLVKRGKPYKRGGNFR